MHDLEKIESRKRSTLHLCVLDTLMSRLEILDRELSMSMNRSVIQKIAGRVKSLESIQAKLLRKGAEVSYETAIERINDIVGVRAVCFFMDDLYTVADAISSYQDLEIVKVKNYMQYPKKTGYRSLHLIVNLTIPFQGKSLEVKAEIQLRTLAMDYWAELDHQLRYKKENNKSKEIEKELKEYAVVMEAMDQKMLELRDKIKEVQIKREESGK